MKQQEKLQIILQYLNNHGFHQTTKKLIEQTSQIDQLTLDLNVDQSIVQIITDLIKHSKFDDLELLFTKYISQSKTQQCMYIILKNKYIQLLEQKKINDAIILLRDRIPKYFLDVQQKKQLTDMILQTTFQPQSDVQILDQILNLCHQEIQVVQPDKLINLIQQAQTNKILECPYHKKLENDYSIFNNHQCKQKIVVETKSKDYNISLIEYTSDFRIQVEVMNKTSLKISEQYLSQNQKLIQNEIFQQDDYHQDEILSISISPCNQYIGTTSKDQMVNVLDLSILQKVLEICQNQGSIQDMIWVNNQDTFSNQQKNNNHLPNLDTYTIWTITTDGWMNEWKQDKLTYINKIEENIKIMRYNSQKDQLTIVSTHKISIYSLQTKKLQHSISLEFKIDGVKINSTQEFLIILNQNNYSKFLYYSIPKLELVKQFTHPQTQTSTILSSICFDIGWYNENLIVMLIKDKKTTYIWHRQKGQLTKIVKKVSELNLQLIRINPLNNVLYFYAGHQNGHQNLIQRNFNEAFLLSLLYNQSLN